MHEVVVHPLPELHTEIQEVPTPEPADHEILIKVIAAGSNVKDWDHLQSKKLSANSGDDIAGTVHGLGAAVKARGEFHVGDRVAAFHPMLEPGGAYAEYALAPADTVFILPEHTSFEEAATIPLVTATAALTLFRRLKLPLPWSPRSNAAPPLPLIIYGASSALGSFAIKLAKVANIHPIIAICGGTRDYVDSLLDASKGDTVVDYRQSSEAMIQEVQSRLGSNSALYAFDCISSKGTWIPLTKMVNPIAGKVSVVSGANRYDEAEIPSGVEIIYTYVGSAHVGAYKPGMPKQPLDKEEVAADKEFIYVIFRYLGRLLDSRKFEGHPFEIIPGGLKGVETGLRKLQNGEAKGVKYVYKIVD